VYLGSYFMKYDHLCSQFTTKRKLWRIRKLEDMMCIEAGTTCMQNEHGVTEVY